ncbi:DUF2157 domain-containing protein [Helicobacter sp. MIT 11-5569]|uniref:DUF2157 domain-containing protein n=1 Tax=Helicobacter sp. MIT 11-5569 TaxID=1548151 RepID=UPI00137543F3|nr:DUF2157 domain-containing protein [Helicobacter sp. MIT 11-5569]
MKSEIIKLTDKGLISKNQEQEIFKAYHLDEESEFSYLTIFGFIFIGFSCLALIAYNWEEIPNAFKTLLLLMALFGTHFCIFYCKTLKIGFGILSGFVLLANIALLSQIYHLGDDTALAFFSVGCTLLVLSFALKSSAIFLQSYGFVSVWFFVNLSNAIETNTLLIWNPFVLFIALGFVVQNGVLLKPNPIISKFLAIINFIFLNAYAIGFLIPEKYSYLLFIFTSFVFLSLPNKFQDSKYYKICAYVTLLIAANLNPVYFREMHNIESITQVVLISLILALGIFNLYFKRYLLASLIFYALGAGFVARYIAEIYETYYHDSIIYGFLIFLLGIHCIKESYKILGAFMLLVAIFSVFLSYSANLISVSVFFLICGAILLLWARRKNA